MSLPASLASTDVSCAPVIAPSSPSLFIVIQSRAPSLISSYITASHLHLRVALGSKLSTCDPSRHWDKTEPLRNVLRQAVFPVRLEYLTVCCPIRTLRNHPFITSQIPSFMLSALQVLRCRNP